MTYDTPIPAEPRRLSGSARGWDLGLSITVLVLGSVVLCVTFLIALFGVMMSSACAGDCNGAQFTLGWFVAMIAPFVLLLPGAIWAIVRMVTAKRALVIAIVTVVLAFAAWFGGMAMMVTAVPSFTM